MIISHTLKLIFIKSIKTAGTSVEAVLSQYCYGDDVVTPINDFVFNRDDKGNFIHRSMNADEYREIGQHVDALTIRERVSKKVWNDYLKVSISRNPWDRMVSLFTWMDRNNSARKPRYRFYHRLGISGNQFLSTKKSFCQFLKGDWRTNDQFYIIDDELCVDYIIRYENLVNDFHELCSQLGLNAGPLPQLKSGFRSGHHYSKYYDKTSKAIVAERHKNDLRLLGYEFETP